MSAQADLAVGEADGRPELSLALGANALTVWASHRRLAVAAALAAEAAAAVRRVAAVRGSGGLPQPARVRPAVVNDSLRCAASYGLIDVHTASDGVGATLGRFSACCEVL